MSLQQRHVQRSSATERTAHLLEHIKVTLFGISLFSALHCQELLALPRDLDVVEVFTTVKAIALAATAQGLAAEVYDYIFPGHPSALTKEGFWYVARLVMRLKPGGLLCIAPCCSSFGFAPMQWTQRNRNNFSGDTTYPPVADGNSIARFAIFFYSLAALRDAEAAFENPSGSMIFSFLADTWRTLQEQGLANKAGVDIGLPVSTPFPDRLNHHPHPHPHNAISHMVDSDVYMARTRQLSNTEQRSATTYLAPVSG
jgi:hypothetical protein